MTFFQQNATFNEGGEYEVADDGLYLCRLKEIETLQQPSFDDPSLLEDKFKFVFEALESVDSKGNPFRFVKFTKTGYGNEKAALTLLLDSMLGKHLTNQEFASLDLEDIKARKFRVNVELTTNTKGNEINKILSVKPNKAGGGIGGNASASNKPKPKDDDADDDKFGDDPFEK